MPNQTKPTVEVPEWGMTIYAETSPEAARIIKKCLDGSPTVFDYWYTVLVNAAKDEHGNPLFFEHQRELFRRNMDVTELSRPAKYLHWWLSL